MVFVPTFRLRKYRSTQLVEVALVTDLTVGSTVAFNLATTATTLATATTAATTATTAAVPRRTRDKEDYSAFFKVTFPFPPPLFPCNRCTFLNSL